MVSPSAIHLDACSTCQLRCPACLTSEAGDFFGRGRLKLSDFQKLLDRNPWIRKVDFANKGEIFLNRDLPAMLRYAHENNVALNMNHGANLNTASQESLEALVECQVERLRVSIDGATQASYGAYRVGGRLSRVIANIQRINALKKEMGSSRPQLILQFIIFGHNMHEIGAASVLARILKMELNLMLNRLPESLSEDDREQVRRRVGYADRRDFFLRKGGNYRRCLCYQLWKEPLIGWDGRLLGCVRNISCAYAEDVFEKDLMACIRSERIQLDRDMLMGKEPPRPELPCVRCDIGRDVIESGNWLTEREIYGDGRSATG